MIVGGKNMKRRGRSIISFITGTNENGCKKYQLQKINEPLYYHIR
jgi:hypothetical protein